MNSGWRPGRALAYNAVSALPFLAGGILAYALAGSVDVTILVPFAAGNFVYIALADLLPQMTVQERARDKAGAGVGLPRARPVPEDGGRPGAPPQSLSYRRRTRASLPSSSAPGTRRSPARASHLVAGVLAAR